MSAWYKKHVMTPEERYEKQERDKKRRTKAKGQRELPAMTNKHPYILFGRRV